MWQGLSYGGAHRALLHQEYMKILIPKHSRFMCSVLQCPVFNTSVWNKDRFIAQEGIIREVGKEPGESDVKETKEEEWLIVSKATATVREQRDQNWS